MKSKWRYIFVISALMLVIVLSAAALVSTGNNEAKVQISVIVENSAESIFGIIGQAIAIIFKPLGFGEWRAAMSLVVGFVAKEAVVGTLGVLYGLGEGVLESPEMLVGPLRNVFTPLSAYSFMIFTLLYLPCVAAFATMKREMNSWKWTLLAVGYQTGVAWLVAFVVYQVGSLILG